MIAIGGAIGTGLFLGSGNRFEIAGPGLAIVYAIRGIFAFIVVRALGELALYRPSSGAFVSYAREFFGEKGAYTVGWLYFLDWAATLVADITAVAVYTHFWSFFLPVPQWLIALIALAVVLTMNLISVKLFGEMEFWFAFIKVGAIILFGVIGIWVVVTQHPIDGNVPGFSLIAENGGLIQNGIGSLFAITLGVVFAFAGIEMVGTAPRFAKRMNKSGIPYGGILITSIVGIPGVILNVLMPEDAFALMLNISGIGTVAAWSSIMLSHWAFVRKSRRGEVTRPEFKLPFAPFLNAFTLGFLLLVVVLIGFDGEIGRLTLVLTAIIGVFLVIGWFGVRGRINAAAMTDSMDVASSIAPLEDPVKDNPNEK